MDGLHKIIENRFTKEVSDLDCKHGGEWLTLGVMLYSLLQTHGRYLSLQTILRQWMKNLASYFKEFSLMEKLYALWACSQSNSPLQDLISEKEKQNFTLAFKNDAMKCLRKRSSSNSKRISQQELKVYGMHDSGADFVNSFFCRSVFLETDGNSTRASDLLQVFQRFNVGLDYFMDDLKKHLETISGFRGDHVNSIWTLLFYVTHVYFAETGYTTKTFPRELSDLRSFISDFCVIAAQKKAIQMADSLSELILCLEIEKENENAIYSMTRQLVDMISDEGLLIQKDSALKDREDLHSKMASSAALVKVLLYMDGIYLK